MEILRYVIASLALGLISVWASENLFWSAPPDDLTLAGFLMTWGAYTLASACALSAVAWSGLGGWRGLFLGGAILGFVVEGVIVGTMYDNFPLQLVWTPLAWHALLTALAVGGVARMNWPLPQLIAVQLALGMFAGVWALYWPTERVVLPGSMAVIVYIAGVGLLVTLAHGVLDWLGNVPRPKGWILGVVPVLAAGLWIWQSIAAPQLLRLACPVMIGLTVWAMRRMGPGSPVRFGAHVGLVRRLSVMLVPVGMLAVALPGWAYLGAVAVNVPFALATGWVSFGLWLWLLWQAMRAGR